MIPCKAQKMENFKFKLEGKLDEYLDVKGIWNPSVWLEARFAFCNWLHIYHYICTANDSVEWQGYGDLGLNEEGLR